MVHHDQTQPPSAPAYAEIPPGERLAALRIVDASANRAAEGLRVVEEYCRFALNDRFLSQHCKQMRHRLAQALADLPTQSLAAARSTTTDVGTTLSTPQELHRDSLRQLALANSKRVEQSLRVLEEYSKLLGVPAAAATFERLRYDAYTLEKCWTVLQHSLERLAEARLYVLLDGRASDAEFARLAESLVGAGVHVLQLRDKRLDDRTLLSRARRLRELTRGTQTLLIVNDRPDIAAIAQADGVHVGQEELGVADVRRIVGPDMLVGVSTHSLEQARQAVLDGANYLGCGPTFPSGTKSFESFPGLDYLQAVAAEIALPAFAIGGITLANLPDVLRAGFSRIAVSGAVVNSSDPQAAAQSLAKALSDRANPWIRYAGHLHDNPLADEWHEELGQTRARRNAADDSPDA